MSTTDKDQQSIMVRQHARLAMGVPLNGQSMQAKDQPKQEPKLLKKK